MLRWGRLTMIDPAMPPVDSSNGVPAGGIMHALTRGPEEEGWGGMSWGSSDDDH